MKYRVTHETRYAYSAPVSMCHNEAHLLPRDSHRQSCIAGILNIRPNPVLRHEREDFFGNKTSYFQIQIPHKHLVVRAISEVEVRSEGDELLRPAPLAWEVNRDRLAQDQDLPTLDARQYVLNSGFIETDAAIAAYARPSFEPGRPLLEVVEDVMGRVHEDFTYDPEFSSVATPLSEVLAHRRGVCQDFAHLAIACLRAHGLAARYVSGYLETEPPPGQARLRGADASHAWFSVYVAGYGWVDFDPTNNQVPQDRHITTAWGRDYGDVTPLKGVLYGGGDHVLDVAVDVERLE